MQFHLKNKCTVRADRGAYLAVAIGEVWRNKKAPLTAGVHELHAFGPTLDNLVERKCGWLPPLYGTVENGTVDRCAMIVTIYSACSSGFWPCALADNFVLQTTWQFGNASLLFVGGKKIKSCL